MRHSSFRRRYHPGRRGTPRLLRCEPLEHRWLLSITVDTLFDEADGSIDDGDISLRDAIAAAESGETIDFDASLDGGTVLLTMGELAVERSVTIDAISLESGLTIEGSGSSRVFNMDDGDDGSDSPVMIRGLTLTGGHARDGGGAIRSAENLTVSSSTISGNTAGGWESGGGIWASGNLTVTSSTILENTGYAAGGIWASGELIVTSSTISGNRTRWEGCGGGIRASGDLTVTSSTISGNKTRGSGGGNCASDEATVTIENSIVADNSGSDTAPDIRTDVGELAVRYSLIGDNRGTSLVEGPVGVQDADGNLIGGPIHGVVDPMLAPLADYGGPTKTHALAPGSPAIDAGDPSFQGPPAFDQRGVPFVRVFEARVDMGAIERQPLAAGPMDLIVDTLVDERDTDFGAAGDLSLREAVLIANFRVGADTITFDASLNGGTIELTQGELVVFDAVTIDATPLVAGITIDASGISRVFNVDDGDDETDSPATIGGLTLTGGHASDGGAIRSAEDLTVSSSTISGNTASRGGGIWAANDVTITSSTILRNELGRDGNGGGIWGSVTSSTISSNETQFSDGGGISASGDVTVNSSTISGNTARWGGGGISASGNVGVTTSTISGNTAGRYGDGGGIWAAGDVTVTSSTISENETGRDGGGGGVYGFGDVRVTIDDSIVADNSDSGSAPDIHSDAGELSVRYSLIGDNTGTSFGEAPIGAPDANGNLIGGLIHGVIDPMLAPLADNGGPTETHAMLAGSPAIDAGDPDFVPPPEFDQRGNPRVADGNADAVPRIDMGAFEVLLGDINGDGEVNGLDVDSFVDVLLNGPSSAAADMNADGGVNGLDVDPFVAEVVGGAAPVGALGTEHALSILDVGSTSRQLHCRRLIHDSNHDDDPAHVIHRRTVQHALTRQPRPGGSVREAGQRSPPGDIIHDVHHEASVSWHLDVDLAMRDDTNWDRLR